jgi:hypothetical protein
MSHMHRYLNIVNQYNNSVDSDTNHPEISLMSPWTDRQSTHNRNTQN